MSNIRDVAEAAGVSPATVSRVLNGKATSLVSEATRERVLDAAQSLGYHPSAAARALVAGRTDTIALATTNIHDPHYARALDVAQDIAEEFGYHLLLVPDADDTRLQSLLRERRADVIVRLRYPVDTADEVAAAVVSDEQVVIAVGPVDRQMPLSTPCACWDDREGIRAAVEHLAELGHRRVAFLAGRPAQRKERYALEAAGTDMTIVPVCIEPGSPDDVARGAAIARLALQREPGVTALLAQNDTFALGALHALHEDGVAVPEQVSVVGYNDTLMTSYSSPPLTTVRTPLVECVGQTLRQVLESLSRQDCPIKLQALQMHTELVIRASTAHARNL